MTAAGTTSDQPTLGALVEQLREILRKNPERVNATVVLEGCDCCGDWDGEIDTEAADLILLGAGVRRGCPRLRARHAERRP
jgi:hypothetical protein